jgi:SLT domain-containing protein
MTGYSTGTRVSWNWGQGTAEGRIETVYTDDVTRTIKGTEVTRKASDDAPAYYIKQSDGDAVLKSHSEVEEV